MQTLIRSCDVCGNPVAWQGLLFGSWAHTDSQLDLDHAAVYIPPTPRACCGGD